MSKPSWAADVMSQQKVIEETRKAIEKRMMDPKHVWGYSWGFRGLDLATGGIKYDDLKELTIVGARSGVGKSSFGMSVALSVASRFKKHRSDLDVRIILLEMEPQACVKRLIGQIADVPLKKLWNGFLEYQEKERARKAMQVLDGLPLRYLKGTHDVKVIEEFVKAESSDGKRCGLWLVDHIGIVPADGENMAWTLGKVSKAFQNLARRVAPGVVLSQLNRDSLKRKDPTPTVSDIYGSDKIYQDSDNIFLLDRPDLRAYRSQDEQLETEVAYIHISKQREGEANFSVPVAFTTKQAMWSDIDPEDLKELQI